MHFIYNKHVIRILSLIAAVYMLYYLVWRAVDTLNPHYFVLSLLLLIAEAQGVANFLLFTMMTWNTEPKKAEIRLNTDKTIDVFVPTYNEDIEILEATLIGCMNMRIPHNTYVLDDGRRPHVKELADRLGCGYLTRPDNKHAKAGNINSALRQTSGELVAIFDADMVPQPDFLEKTIGYFEEDDRVAIVQLPQEFYNMDSVQHTDEWHEQQLFFRVIQPGKDNIGATFWCGSPSIVSRQAFEEIGGVATESITEDFHTSIRLNAKGWKIRFHNEVLAYGIAPQSLQAFNLQRLRWAQGAMQIFRSKESPLIAKGLNWKQRLSHFSAIFTYFDCYQKLIYLLTPALFILFGILPIKATSGLEFIMNWAPYFLLTLLANIAMGRGYFNYFRVEKYNILKMFTFIQASLTVVWPKALTFKVTPKSVDQSIKQKDRSELLSHFLVFIVVALSLVLGIVQLVQRRSELNAEFIDTVISVFWLVVNASLLFMALRGVLSRLYYRQNYRFPLNMNGIIEFEDGQRHGIRITDISRYGLGMAFSDAYQGPIDGGVHIRFQSNGHDLLLPGKVAFDRTFGEGGTSRKVGIQFSQVSEQDEYQLVYLLFVTLPRIIESQKGRPAEFPEAVPAPNAHMSA